MSLIKNKLLLLFHSGINREITFIEKCFSLFRKGMIILFLIVTSFHTSYSQVPKDDIKENLLEESTESNDAVTQDYESIEDLSNSLVKNPINLNKASGEDLQQLVELHLLNDLQVNAFLNYRQKLGELISIYELQAVPYFDVPTIENILPYITIDKDITNYNASLKELLTRGDYMLLLRGQQILETQKGYTPVDSSSRSYTRYSGSPQTLYARFRYNFGTRLSYGVTAQKDAGEEFFKGTQPGGFDFYSAHFFIRGNKFLKSLAVGDYELRFGQGLIMCTGFSTGKSPMVLQILKGGRTLRPYASVNEYNFFRGAAVELGKGKFAATGFFSYKKIDAGIVTVDTVSEMGDVISSYGGDGYHRTPTEIAKKNVVPQTVYGGNIKYSGTRLQIGTSAFQSLIDATVNKQIYPYNQFSTPNNQLTNASVDYNYQIGNVNLFGEAAMSGNGGKGILQGMLISLDPKVDMSLLYRNYERNFQTLYSSGFGESSVPNNEKGLYTGISIRPVARWQLDGYIDFSNKPWLDFMTDAPSHNTDYFTQLTWTPSKTIEIYARYKDESKQTNFTNNTTPIDYLTVARRQNARFNVKFKASSSVSFQSRVEWVKFHQQTVTPSYGYLVFQDIIYKSLSAPLAVTLRYCLFDVDSYDARIYTYESDVLYGYSIPSFQNRGSRFYILTRYSLNRHVDFWIRYAQTYYTNIKTIGSGLDNIEQPKKSEVKVEMRLRF